MFKKLIKTPLMALVLAVTVAAGNPNDGTYIDPRWEKVGEWLAS